MSSQLGKAQFTRWLGVVAVGGVGVPIIITCVCNGWAAVGSWLAGWVGVGVEVLYFVCLGKSAATLLRSCCYHLCYAMAVSKGLVLCPGQSLL